MPNRPQTHARTTERPPRPADVFDTLTGQHSEITTLIDRVRRDRAKRHDLWPRIRTELLSHDRAELVEVYPALGEYDETKDLVGEHDRQADEIEELIDKLDMLKLASDEWGDAFDELADTVSRHARLEETEIFPLARRVLGARAARELDAEFRATQQKIADSV